MLTKLASENYNDREKYPHYEKRIDINNPDVIRNWCEILGCAKDELKEAVKIAGDSVKAVREYFK